MSRRRGERLEALEQLHRARRVPDGAAVVHDPLDDSADRVPRGRRQLAPLLGELAQLHDPRAVRLFGESVENVMWRRSYSHVLRMAHGEPRRILRNGDVGASPPSQ